MRTAQNLTKGLPHFVAAWLIWNQQEEPSLERKSLFYWRESKRYGRSTNTNLPSYEIHWRRKGPATTCPCALQYNSCVLSNLNKKTPLFTQDFSAVMIPRWKPRENNQCYEAERGEKGRKRAATYSFICPYQLWEIENRRDTYSPSQKSWNPSLCLGKVRGQKQDPPIDKNWSTHRSALLVLHGLLLKESWSSPWQCSVVWTEWVLLWLHKNIIVLTGVFFSLQLGSTNSTCQIVVLFGRTSITDEVCVQVLAFWLV